MNRDPHSQYILRPEKPTDEELKEMGTTEGLIRRIREYSNYDSLVRSCFQTARANNDSDFTAIVMIAFHALAELQKTKALLLKQVSLRQNPFVPHPDQTHATKINKK